MYIEVIGENHFTVTATKNGTPFDIFVRANNKDIIITPSKEHRLSIITDNDNLIIWQEKQ